MSAKPADLDNVIDYQAAKANIWVQLKTWDAQAMRDVIAAVNEYKKANPMPMDLKPAGTAYFNLVWSEEVLWDIIKGFIIALIYGVIGFMGKDFDMPISVLSCLSLGMAVDFAIHFISRFRRRMEEQE